MRRLRMLAAALALGACGGGGDKPSTQARTLSPPRATVTTPTVPTTPIDPVPTVTTPSGTATTPTSTATTPTVPTTTATTPSTGTTPTTTATTPTAPSSSPVSCGTANGGFLRDIRASGVPCGTARATALAWLRAVQLQGPRPGPLAANGSTCRARIAGERADVSCRGSSGPAAVTFTASP